MTALVRHGVLAAYTAAVLGVTSFVLVLLGPRDGAVRARSGVSITAAVLGWAVVPLAVGFLVGVLVAAGPLGRGASLAAFAGVVVTSAATLPHLRFLVEYASYDVLDRRAAARLADTQTGLATTIFAVLLVSVAAAWLAVALLVAPAAGLGVGARVALVVAGIGMLLPVPLTPLALAVAGAALDRAGRRTGGVTTAQGTPAAT